MNSLLNGMKELNNFVYTENGALTHKTTQSKLLDMFALGGSYRNRSEDDVITLFKKAFRENPEYTLKCLFYLRDCRGGQGERRFFRVCYEWLIDVDLNAALRNLPFIAEYGRWDDLVYIAYNSKNKQFWNATVELIESQLTVDIHSMMNSETTGISLLAKWMPSINTSSEDTREVANALCKALHLTPKAYRQTLSKMRERIKVLERLMSANRWDEIEFDKIPSKAGLVYRNAFARRDIIKAKYEAFAQNKEAKVNANLNPVDVAHQCFTRYYELRYTSSNSTERLMLQKYWDNLPNYYGDRVENGIAVVDVSGSMTGTPMEAAVSLGAYVAERGKGPFANHFITFSDSPALVEFEGVDIFDKFNRAVQADWGNSTNIEAVMDLILGTALKHKVSADDMPKRLYIFSDMEFNQCIITNHSYDRYSYRGYRTEAEVNDMLGTFFEATAKKWAAYGYTLPQVVFWNLDARNENIPAIGSGFSYVSGFNPNMIECILSGKDGYDLMMMKLDSDRYAPIH